MKTTQIMKAGFWAILLCTAQLISQEPANEHRIVFPWYFNNASDSKGSLTFAPYKDNPDLMGVFADRPGDELAMNMNGGGVIIWSGIGSEIRADGNIQLFGKNLTITPGSRLCFKRAEDGWVHVCGLGQAEDIETKEIIKLGYARTIESCLSLLSSSDPVLREGAARDIGRLAAGKDMPPVVPQLVALLSDSVPSVRCGAAEGLGLIGQQECVVALKSAATKETDETTKEFIAEALSLCAGRVLIKETTSPSIPLNEAANLYSSGKTGWINSILSEQIKAGSPATVNTLIGHLKSTTVAVRLASTQLLGAVKCIKARGMLNKLSTTDRYKKVREAAKEALEKIAKEEK